MLQVDSRGVSSGAIGPHISWHIIRHDQFSIYESIFLCKFKSNDIFSGCQNKKKMSFIIVIRECVMKSTHEKKHQWQSYTVIKNVISTFFYFFVIVCYLITTMVYPIGMKDVIFTSHI